MIQIHWMTSETCRKRSSISCYVCSIFITYICMKRKGMSELVWVGMAELCLEKTVLEFTTVVSWNLNNANHTYTGAT